MLNNSKDNFAIFLSKLKSLIYMFNFSSYIYLQVYFIYIEVLKIIFYPSYVNKC